MDDTATQPQYPSQYPQPPRSRKWPRRLLTGVIALALVGIGAAIGSGGSKTVTKIVKVPGPTITKTAIVKVPSGIKTVIKTVKVPGPTVTKTQYVPASQGPTGITIAKFSGSGNQATGSFSVPSTGDYIVKWSYGGNNDCSLGSCQGSNFAISENNSQAFGGNFPNDIAGSGSGSTEVTGDSGSPSFNVQAVAGGWWTITVISA